MSTPDEFKEKKSVSIGLVAWAVVIAFNLGVLYATMLATKDDVSNNKTAAKQYTEQEVGGLRSDWERNNEEVKLRFEQIQKELDKYTNN